MSSIPKGYREIESKYKPERNGVLISFESGTSTAYALDMAQARGILFIPPQVPVYQGMIVGLSNKKDDIDLNVCREKQLTNMRASGADDKARIIPHTVFSLEEALEYIREDEYVEVTPKSMRMRKIILDHNARKRASRQD